MRATPAHELGVGGLARYRLAMNAGPSFNGPHAGFLFVGGLSTETYDAPYLRARGSILNISQAWEVREGHHVEWVTDSWACVHDAPPVSVALSSGGDGGTGDSTPTPPGAVADGDAGPESSTRRRGRGRRG